MEHVKQQPGASRFRALFRERPISEKEQKEKSSRRLDSQSVLLLTVNGLFAVANALSGTFVNVYLWKAKNDFALIGWFSLVQQITMGLTFWLAGKWVKEHNKMNSLRLGVAVSALFYLLVLMLGKEAVHYIFALGLVQGMAGGFFWLAFNVVYFEVTNPDNRDRFNGWAGLLGSGSGIVAPWVSGLLITTLPGGRGYTVIFSISLAIFVIGVIISFFLKKRKVKGHYRWMYSLAQLKERGNPWRRVVPALAAQGIREGVFGFMIGLMVYIATRNEMKLGNFSLITSAVGLFSFWLIGRWLKKRNRKIAMLIGTGMMSLVILPFFWKVNYATLLMFGIGTSLFIPLFSIPMTSSVFDLIGANEDSAQKRVEYIVLRELALTIGRAAGTIAFLLVVSQTTKPFAITLLLFAVGSAPLLGWIFIRNDLNQRKPSPAS
jgi:YQGE family putative transporter